MINFKARSLTGFYHGSTGNQFADFLKIQNSFHELAIDLPLIDNRITALENNAAGIITNLNFTDNSIEGSIFVDGSIDGTKITDNSITGDQLIIDSVHGIRDENIASDAAINPSKINLGLISHTTLTAIGTTTHTDIDLQLAQLFHDVGSVVNTPLSVPLDTRVTAVSDAVNNLTTDISTLYTFVNPDTLTTTAQNVSDAINELRTEVQSIGGSGYAITGPGGSTTNAIVTWLNSTGQALNDSSVTIETNLGASTVDMIFDNAFTNKIGAGDNPIDTLYTLNVSPANPSGLLKILSGDDENDYLSMSHGTSTLLASAGDANAAGIINILASNVINLDAASVSGKITLAGGTGATFGLYEDGAVSVNAPSFDVTTTTGDIDMQGANILIHGTTGEYELSSHNNSGSGNMLIQADLGILTVDALDIRLPYGGSGSWSNKVVDVSNGGVLVIDNRSNINAPTYLATLRLVMSVATPTVTDDITAGFMPFSRWIVTGSQNEYVCIDNTAGNAVWKQTT